MKNSCNWRNEKKQTGKFQGKQVIFFYSSSFPSLRQGSFYQLLRLTCHHPTHRVNTSLTTQLGATPRLTYSLQKPCLGSCLVEGCTKRYSERSFNAYVGGSLRRNRQFNAFSSRELIIDKNVTTAAEITTKLHLPFRED